ncbi:retrovirus-related pol polyprotein from transposon TNT 1-94 [Tanacetum coccineum]|uniref:Retrovirus-related pol polyprotein from transposon TNT 1-94 n=1 Tax=Tanacetum coccineum TaxID=301880 RepID=A0ABQ5C0F2_9ASTR
MEGVVTVMPITTADEKAQRRLEVKARSTLMMGIPNEHRLKFNSIKDAKKLLEAVEKRFAQRCLIKTFDRLQKLVSQLELLDEKLSQEDVNQKLLRSLSPEWNTHAVVWRNKVDLDTINMDDLYNNLKYKDTKTLFAAIQTRFGGNDATKKTYKTLLKQMYENFSDLSTESRDSIFNRLQKIVSQLAILGKNISQEDLNLKFLRSLPSEWNTHVVVWRNKPNLDTMSFNDLYNNFNIVEQEVKGTENSSSSSSSQNMAFVTSPSSTNEVNTAFEISTANTQASHASNQVSTGNLSDAIVYAFLANQPNGSQLVHEDLEQIHKDDLEEMDLKWQLALLSMRTRRGPGNQDSRNWNQDSSRRTVNVEETYSKVMLAIDGAGFDWSYMADDEVPTNMALMDFSDSEIEFVRPKQQGKLVRKPVMYASCAVDLEVTCPGSLFRCDPFWGCYKRGLASVEEQLVFYKKNELEKFKQEKESNQLKIENFDNASKSLDKLIGSQITDKSRNGVGLIRYNAVPPPPTGLFSPSTLDLSNSGLEEFQQPKLEGYGPKSSKSVSEDTTNKVGESLDAPLVKELLSKDKLEKKTTFPTSKIDFVRPKQQEKPVRKPVKYAEMYRLQDPRGNQRNWNNQKSQQLGSNFVMYNKACFVCGSFDHVQANYNYHQRERVVSGNNYTRVNYNYSAKKIHPNAYRNMAPRVVLMKNGLRPLNTTRPVNTGSFYTARPKAVNTARPNSAVVNAVRENQVNVVKVSVCWVWRPTKLNSASITFKRHNYVGARGRSKHMTGNMSYLTDFKEFDEGYVTFGRGAKGGRITGKCTLKTGKLDFEDVYFVKELQFNLFSVSQTCDKKNSVLFTDTGCFVLSPDFKLTNESQVLLKVPRKNNMYSIDMKNIVPKESLTYLVTKTTLDESMLWHMRLGHNRVLVVKPHNKTPYELFRGRTPSLSFMRPFRCYVIIFNTLDHLGKFDGKYDDGFIVEYSLNSKAFRVYKIRTRKVEENLHISFLEDKPIIVGDGPKWLFDINVLTKSMNYVPVVAGTNYNDSVDGSLFDSSLKNTKNDEPQPSNNAEKKDDEGGIDDQEKPEDIPSTLNTRIHKDHSLEHVIGDVQSGVQTRRITNEQGFINAIYEAKTHEDLHTCLFACFLSQEEPKKKDERGVVIRNKTRLVTQGYTQEEGIDYDEVFAPVARIEAIRLFLAYASFKDFVVHQMDVKSAFLYGKIEEEVFVCQPLGFEDPEFPNKVYKRGQIDKTLFIKRVKGDILLVQVYVDDIIFGSTRKEMCTDFETMMNKKFQMSSLGELIFFLGLQVTQKIMGIFISQDKQEIHNKEVVHYLEEDSISWPNIAKGIEGNTYSLTTLLLKLQRM